MPAVVHSSLDYNVVTIQGDGAAVHNVSETNDKSEKARGGGVEGCLPTMLVRESVIDHATEGDDLGLREIGQNELTANR